MFDLWFMLVTTLVYSLSCYVGLCYCGTQLDFVPRSWPVRRDVTCGRWINSLIVSAMLYLTFILRWQSITMGCIMYLWSRKYVATILFLLYYKRDIRLIYPYVVPNLKLMWITSSGQQKVVQNHFLWDKFCQKLRTCFWLNQYWLMVIWEPLK